MQRVPPPLLKPYVPNCTPKAGCNRVLLPADPRLRIQSPTAEHLLSGKNDFALRRLTDADAFLTLEPAAYERIRLQPEAK